MSEINVSVDAVEPAKIQVDKEKVRKTIDLFLKVLKGVAAITATELDNKLAALIEALMTDDILLDAIVLILDVLPDNPSPEQLRAAFQTASMKLAGV